MPQQEPLPPPPYLQGVYLRDDFELSRSGSAFERYEVEAQEEETKQEKSSPQSTTLMDDDEFLQSLITPEANFAEDTTKANEPVEPPAPTTSTGKSAQHDSQIPRDQRFQFSIPWMHQQFELNFPNAVTFFVGENGSGKSTLIEAIASLCGYPVSGGGTNDATSRFGPEKDSELAHAMYPNFRKRHRDGYFLRAEFYAHFASLLEERERDPDFNSDPYKRYGGKSLHQQSHGESFLALLQNRFRSGLFLLDEPEAALSPQRQLSLLAMILNWVSEGKSQFIIATHSPILMTYPGATIINFDSDRLEEIPFEETTHYHLTRGILENPNFYWKNLMEANKANSA